MEDLLPVTSTEELLPVDFVQGQRSFCSSVSLCSMKISELEGGKGATLSSCADSRVPSVTSQDSWFILEDFRLRFFLQMFKPTMVVMFRSERTCIGRRHIEEIRQTFYLVSS